MCYVAEDHLKEMQPFRFLKRVTDHGKMPSVLRSRYRNLNYPSYAYTIYPCSMRGIIFHTGCDRPCARASRAPNKRTATIVSERTGSDRSGYRSGYAKVGPHD
jgi:hypothetical protein